jgi:hypothetical protein
LAGLSSSCLVIVKADWLSSKGSFSTLSFSIDAQTRAESRERSRCQVRLRSAASLSCIVE